MAAELKKQDLHSSLQTEINNKLNSTTAASTYQPKSIVGSTTIPTTGWVAAGNGINTYKYNLAIAGVTVNDVVELYPASSSQLIVSAADMNLVTDEYAGGVTIYANNIPTQAIPTKYKIDKF